jgi:hypothetical protein
MAVLAAFAFELVAGVGEVTSVEGSSNLGYGD